jgi:malonate-semialdehyde dehydrogenase (acetylating) / methylmalonate-semialdehyde dehydrogenase
VSRRNGEFPLRAFAGSDESAAGAGQSLDPALQSAEAMATATEIRTLSNYVGGAWVPASGAEMLDVDNPATGELLARVPLSNAADLDAAVRAAREALPVWRDVSVIARARKLFELRAGLDARREDLARSVTIEMGKTIDDARAEVARMIEMVEAACAIPTTMQGRVLEDVSRGIDAETIRQPVGVCAAIVPFNFPAMVPFWFLPFAIGCGNAFILKPSEQVPLTQQIAFEVLDSLGLPPGVVNLVNGGREVVEGILEHDGIDAVSFVGSAPVARIVYERSAATGKRVQALGGAKNHMVVMPDASMRETVNGIIGSAFGAAGQRCMAGSVLVTVGDAHDLVVPPLVEAARGLTVGDGLDESVQVGPVVSGAARDRIVEWIARGEQAGANVELDGRGASDGSGGAFVGPTILTGVQPDMDIAREEVFGPVLAVVQVDTLDDAIAAVNRSRFGNGVSIFTESGAAVRRFRHEVQAGMVGVNIGVAAPVAFFPFSGWKASFLGDLHAHGLDAIDFFTRKKTVTSRFFTSGRESGSYFVEK